VLFFINLVKLEKVDLEKTKRAYNLQLAEVDMSGVYILYLYTVISFSKQCLSTYTYSLDRFLSICHISFVLSQHIQKINIYKLYIMKVFLIVKPKNINLMSRIYIFLKKICSQRYKCLT